MSFSTYGDPVFGLFDVKVAKWNATNDYADAVDVMSAQMMASTLVPVSAELQGDDRITAIHSIMTTGRIRLRFGGAPVEVLAVVLGLTPTSSQTSPNEVKNLRVRAGNRLPYFGINGQALASQGEGAQEIFAPKCKVMGEIQATMNEYGGFQILEFEIQAVDDESYGLLNIIPTEAVRAVTVPPLDIVVDE